MSGIDYSKWDALVAAESAEDMESCSDDDAPDTSSGLVSTDPPDGRISVDTETVAQSSSPSGSSVVVRVTAPSRVTIGPDGVTQEVRHPLPLARVSPFRNPPPTERPASDTARCFSADPTQPQTHNTNSTDDERFPRVSSVCAEGIHERLILEALTQNGAVQPGSHLWSQTREALVIHFCVPQETRGADIRTFSLQTSRQASAQGLGRGCEEEENPARKCVMDRQCVYTLSFTNAREPESGARHAYTFCHPVVVPDEDQPAGAETDDRFDETCWELTTHPALGVRLLTVHVNKQPIGAGVYHWWDRLFTTDTVTAQRPQAQADVGRGQATGSTDTTVETPAARAWREAHEAFRERVRARPSRET